MQVGYVDAWDLKVKVLKKTESTTMMQIVDKAYGQHSKSLPYFNIPFFCLGKSWTQTKDVQLVHRFRFLPPRLQDNSDGDSCFQHGIKLGWETEEVV